MTSKHLETVISKNHGSTTMQVVFFDIVAYSKRKSTAQYALIEKFTGLLSGALHIIGQKYLQYAQDHDANFANDIIKIPTGDGAAVVFTFEGVERIGLDFITCLLEAIHAHNTENGCERFASSGWCNCHTSFLVRVGASEGRGIIFKDVNGLYNVAGTTINLASRVMGQADGMNVLFTKDAYRNLVDMTTDTTLEEQFREYANIKIKHGLSLDLYQYRPKDQSAVNIQEPYSLKFSQKFSSLSSSMGMPTMDRLGQMERKEQSAAMEEILDMMGRVVALTSGGVLPPTKPVPERSALGSPDSDERK
jgi:hypothetical protein